MEVFSRGVNLIICALWLTCLPVLQGMEEQERLLEQYLVAETEWLKAKVTEKGRLSLEDYQRYQEIFEKLGGVYSYEISLAKQLLFGKPQEEAEIYSLEETEHVHTPDCYAGHNHQASGCELHVHEGSPLAQGGCYQEPTNAEKPEGAEEYVLSCGKPEGWQCDKEEITEACCSQVIVGITACEEYQTLADEALINTEVVVTWLNGEQSVMNAEVCYQSDYGTESKLVLGVSGICDTARDSQIAWKYCELTVVWQKQKTICEYGHQYLETGNGCPYCAQTLVGMRLELEKEHYQAGEELQLRVFLQYQNGGEAESSDWSSDYQAYLYGGQKVTVFCEGIQQELEVWVDEERSYCTVCEAYYEETEGVCPVCYNTVIALEASGCGKYGEAAELEVYLIFRDGHRQQLRQGYTIEGYQAYQTGKQQIKVSYQEMSCELEIIVSESGEVGMEQVEEKAYCFEPEYDQFEMLYREQIEKILSKYGEIILLEKFFINITFKKCNILPLFSVINSGGFFKAGEFCYMTGGKIG